MFDAIKWALEQRAGSAPANLVLVRIADLVRPPDMKAFASALTLAAMTELDEKTVRLAMKRLEQRGLIRRTGERRGLGGVPVVVLNMTKGLPENGQTSTKKVSPKTVRLQPAGGDRSPGIGASKSGHSGPEVSPKTDDDPVEPVEPVKRARRCPIDFVVTSGMREQALIEAPGIDVDLESAKFRDYEFKVPRSDWPAAWRNWIRKATEYRAARRPKAPDLREMDYGSSE